jgi:recombination protein RecA
MYICQPDHGEQALDVADKMIQSSAVDIVVIDSVSALVPQKELEAEMGEQTVGLQARLMSQALRKLTASVAKSNCTLIFINQIREKVGVMYGNPEITSGGRALAFYSSIRMDVRRVETVKISGEATSNKVRVKVIKNKVAPPFREAIVEIVFGKGLDKNSELLDIAIKDGYVIKSGAWYSLPSGERMGQGSEAAKKYIEEHEEFKKDLLEKISKKNEE